MPTEKDNLLGLQLKDGWQVVEQVKKLPGETGGFFSTGYFVLSPTGQKCFLKAIDFSQARHQSDPARFLQKLTEEFNFERDILAIGKSLSRVVTAITDGTVAVIHNGKSEPVQYIILELADEGSLRKMAIRSTRLPMSIALRALHNAAVGTGQLHSRSIAHQDLKPSNVLGFGAQGFKICDVGRASVRGRAATHDSVNVAGDSSHAPPELLYGQIHSEFALRRFGCDAYLVGSLAAFLVTGAPMTALLMRELDDSAKPQRWHGSYASVLSQIRPAYQRAIGFVQQNLDQNAPYARELLLCIEQLCDPIQCLEVIQSRARNRVMEEIRLTCKGMFLFSIVWQLLRQYMSDGVNGRECRAT